MLNRAREWWLNLGRSNQIILGASSLGVLIALLGFVSWASTPEYVPLFSNLSAQDAAAISEKLKEAKVPYRPTQNSTAIEVPAQKRDELRLQLINQGLPHEAGAQMGSDDLSKMGAMVTSAVESKTLLRVKETEIARSIMTMDQVANAIVHIAPADDSPFASQKNVASASVVISMKPGQTIEDGNVRSIVRMTQMSYPGLTDNRISVVDSHGTLLHDPQNTGLGNSNDRIKQQQTVAKAKRDELQALLDRTLGPDKAYVLVNAELNADAVNTESTTVEPGVVTEKTSSTEKATGAGGGAPAGVPGVTSNTGIPTYDANAKGGQPGNALVEKTSQVQMPSVKKETRVQGAGRIEKLTVSALVDTSVKPEQIEAIKTTLQTAIGGGADDKTRLVTVSQVAFDRTAEEKEQKAAEAAARADSTSRMLSVGVPLVLMTAFFLILARAFKRTQRAAELAANPQLALAGAGGMGAYGEGAMYALPDGSMAPVALDEEGNPLPGQTVEMVIGGESRVMGIAHGSDDPRTYEIIEQAFDSQMESIQHLIKTKPEMVAALLKGWTVDE